MCPREGHGFRERAHRIDTVARLLARMEKYVRAGL
jgi:dipeptidyl aminopeptidase/acylaminoacyl peptidase